MTTAPHTPAPALSVRRVGTRAVLVDLPTLDDVLAWHAELAAHPLPGQREIVAAASTVMVKVGSASAATAAFHALKTFQPPATPAGSGREISIDVVYDGADLESVADLLNITTEELITRHTTETWIGAFGGFAPGFMYCYPQHGNWDIPRLDSPRTEVPAGAVGLAGAFSAVYPRKSPGGWQLLGHTDTPMWDSYATEPAYLRPGDRITYRAIRPSISVPDAPQPDSRPVPSQSKKPRRAGGISRPAVRIENSGLLTVYQDQGRSGYADLGVNGSGAVDRTSAWTANDVVGNSSAAAVLENVGGLKLTALVDSVIAVTGAETPVSTTNMLGTVTSHGLATPIQVRAGWTLTVGVPEIGMRSYIAARGGFATHQVLGSSSTDMLSGLGPDALQAGDVLSIGSLEETSVRRATVNPIRIGPRGTDEKATEGNHGVVRCVLGPRDDWFSESEQRRFADTTWTVTGHSNRIGLRLAAPEGQAPLTRCRDGELASEGMSGGCVQVPPNGQPVVFLADHAVTGGYPVIATVIPEDLDIAGQLPPGGTLTFQLVDPNTLTPLFKELS